MDDFYEAVVCCDNCGAVLTLGIPKGTFRETFVVHEECGNCGCELGEAEWLDVLWEEE